MPTYADLPSDQSATDSPGELNGTLRISSGPFLGGHLGFLILVFLCREAGEGEVSERVAGGGGHSVLKVEGGGVSEEDALMQGGGGLQAAGRCLREGENCIFSFVGAESPTKISVDNLARQTTCMRTYLVPPQPVETLYYLCFSPSTAIGPPPR